MSIIRIKDAERLLAKAREVHRPIQVSTFHTVEPDKQGVRRPGLVLQYSLQLNNDDEEARTWAFLEIAFADKKGRVDLSGTVYHRLLQEQAGAAPVDFEVASGR